MASTGSLGGLSGFLRTLKRKRALVVGVALAVSAVAVLASLQRTPSYRSEAKVLVRPLTLSIGGMPAVKVPLNMSTEEELLQTPWIVDVVLRRLGPPATEQELVQELQEGVSDPAEAQVLIFTYTDADPAVAQQRAQVFADVYVDLRRAGALAEIDRRKDAQLEGIDAVERQARSLSRLARLTSDPDEEASLLLRAGLLRSLALQRRTMLSLPTPDPDVASVVQPASAPAGTSQPGRLAIGGIGLLIGLLAGIAAAAIGFTMDERPKGPTELELVTGVPVLASIPHARVPRNKSRLRLVTQATPRSAAAEMYRALATVFARHRHDARVLFVTSADPGEGKSTIAANLAVSLAASGLDVVLVDCNLHGPAVQDLFPGSTGSGLVHVLAGTAELQTALRPSGTDRLHVLDAGRRSPRSAEILASPRLRQVLERLGSAADLVIVDGPSAHRGPDALAVALVSDRVLLVSDALIGHSDRTGETIDRLKELGAQPIGAVLNNSGKGRTANYRPRPLPDRKTPAYQL